MNLPMTSSLLQRLGIALPIIQGPMTGSDTPALAAAVSSAGGLGMLGCGMRSPAAMAEAAAAVRQQTDRPFGMNLFVQATPHPDEATVQAAMERLAPLYAELGLQPQRPTQWCEDFAAQFEALVALRLVPLQSCDTVRVRRRGYQSPALDALLAALQGTQQPTTAWISSP